MKVYVVYRRGVYTQGIFGIYSLKTLAEDAIERAKKFERDKYHKFYIWETDVDKDVKISKSYFGPPSYQN